MTVDPSPPTRADVFEVVLPLVRPFSAAHGTMLERRAVLVRLQDRNGIEGWGECGADVTGYSDPETPASAWADLIERLLPGLSLPAPLHELGGPMARAALAGAMSDLRSAQTGVSLAVHIGGQLRPVNVGAVVGFNEQRQRFLEEVEEYVAAGYRRIKVKIRPGQDVEPLRWIREEWPNVPLAADANGSYRPSDANELRRLDAFDLVFLEQPFSAPDLLAHSDLAQLLATPLCLDESITSMEQARSAIEMGSAGFITIKVARLGGLEPAIAIHDLCVAAGTRAWVGGMLETGIGRAHAVALASLPGFVDPADLSGSDRYFHQDLVAPPWHVRQGTLHPIALAGIGHLIDNDALNRHTVRQQSLDLM